jgi:hypothetical protein
MVFVAAGVLQVGLFLAVVPQDVGRARGLVDAAHLAASLKGKPPDALATTFTDAVVAGCQERLGEELRNLEQRAREQFVEAISKTVKQRLADAPREVGPARTEALEALAREVSAGVASRAAIDAWLGFPPPAEPVQTDASITVQVRATDATGDLAFKAGAVECLAEVGTTGAGNGLIDRGEWVRLGIGLRNNGALPWFSTTATFEPGNECVAVGGRQLAPELAVGAEGQLNVWVYVGADCDTAPSVRVRLADTHRAAGAAFTLRLAPVDVAPPRLTNLKFDTDGLGSSDGSLLGELRAGQRFELSADVELDTSTAPTVAALQYRVPDELRGLFVTLAAVRAPLVPDRGNKLLLHAGDDLDATVVDRDAFEAVVRGSAQGKRWLADVAQGRLWVAFDVTVSVPPPLAVSDEPGVTQRGKRKKDAAVTTGAPLRRDELPRVPANKLVELIKRFLRLSPHLVHPELPGAVSATTGYELVFDEKAFTAEYDAKPEVMVPEVVPPSTATTFRVYRWLAAPVVREPVAEAPPRQPDPEPAPVVAAPTPTPAPAPVEAEPEQALVRLDLGVGATVVGVQGVGAYATTWNGDSLLAIPTAGFRATIGRRFCGLVGLSLASASSQWKQQNLNVVVTEFAAEAGVGVRFFPGSFELVPWLGADFRGRATNLSTALGAGFHFAFGLSATVHASRHFGLFVELGGRLGPVVTGPFANSTALVGDLSFRGVAGVTYWF